ncbi:hypothetical protein Bbelb_190970 [Branchiostoma belcheri]|nr:hypothetical protein Bbelb_190970 [Branchiostoma belcheri]
MGFRPLLNKRDQNSALSGKLKASDASPLTSGRVGTTPPPQIATAQPFSAYESPTVSSHSPHTYRLIGKASTTGSRHEASTYVGTRKAALRRLDGDDLTPRRLIEPELQLVCRQVGIHTNGDHRLSSGADEIARGTPGGSHEEPEHPRKHGWKWGGWYGWCSAM